MIRANGRAAAQRLRPIGITILAIVLAWCGIGALLMAAANPIVPPTLALTWRVVRPAAALYGITAIPAAASLWRQRWWAYRAYLVWACTALIAAAAPGLTQQHAVGGDLGVVLIAFAVAAAVLWFVGQYVRRSVAARAD